MYEVSGTNLNYVHAERRVEDLSAAVFKEYMRTQMLDGRELEVSFDDFPHYLRYVVPET